MGDLLVDSNILIQPCSDKAISNFQFVNNDSGVTLVEIISVLIILGILSGVMVSRMNQGNSEIYSIESIFKSHIRYAQSKSMQSDTAVWGVRINKNLDEYWLFNCDNGQTSTWDSNRRLPPGGTASPESTTDDRIDTSLMKVDINTLLVGNASKSLLTIAYDESGVPFWTEGGTMVFLDPLSATTGLTRLTADISIKLTDNSGNQRTIVISPETGFIE